MITSKTPGDWRELQNDTATILRECEFSVEIEKRVETVRGNVANSTQARESVLLPR